MSNYKERLKIPITGGDDEFFSEDGILVAKGYVRIVIGKRGPYIEFTEDQLIKENIFIPEDQKYRLSNKTTYYNEWRTKGSNIKIYQQKKVVAYADYKIGYWYISPFDLRTKDGIIIEKLKRGAK